MDLILEPAVDAFDAFDLWRARTLERGARVSPHLLRAYRPDRWPGESFAVAQEAR